MTGLRHTPAIGRQSDPPASPAPWQSSRFLKACRREPVDVTPVWLMRQAGRYMKSYRELRARVPFLELCMSPDLVAEVTVGAAETLGVDAAILFADLLLILEPLGFELEYEKGEGPQVRPAIRNSADIDRISELQPGALDYVYQGIGRTRAALSPSLPLIGFAAAPFTLASYLIEGGGSRNYTRTKAFMHRDPGAWRALMERLAHNLAAYVRGQIAAGVQAIQIFDTWVGCLGPADYRDYVVPWSRALFQALPANVPLIHFGTGTAALLELMREAGGSVMGLDFRVELDAAWKRVGYDVGVQGNLDPSVLFADRSTIRSRVERILRQADGRPGHIFNLGHGILPDSPFENVKALVQMVHEGLERSGG
jgi:uroporphyrinogen decarboxylase